MKNDLLGLSYFAKKMAKNLETKVVQEIYRGVVIRVLETVVEHTPQYTGTAASAWSITVNGEKYNTSQLMSESAAQTYYLTRQQPRQQGDDPGVSFALLANRGFNTAMLTARDKVQITNPVSYIDALENQQTSWGGPLRAVNITPGGMVNLALSRSKTSLSVTWYRNVLRETLLP